MKTAYAYPIECIPSITGKLISDEYNTSQSYIELTKSLKVKVQSYHDIPEEAEDEQLEITGSETVKTRTIHDEKDYLFKSAIIPKGCIFRLYGYNYSSCTIDFEIIKSISPLRIAKLKTEKHTENIRVCFDFVQFELLAQQNYFKKVLQE